MIRGGDSIYRPRIVNRYRHTTIRRCVVPDWLIWECGFSSADNQSGNPESIETSVARCAPYACVVIILGRGKVSSNVIPTLPLNPQPPAKQAGHGDVQSGNAGQIHDGDIRCILSPRHFAI